MPGAYFAPGSVTARMARWVMDSVTERDIARTVTAAQLAAVRRISLVGDKATYMAAVAVCPLFAPPAANGILPLVQAYRGQPYTGGGATDCPWTWPDSGDHLLVDLTRLAHEWQAVCGDGALTGHPLLSYTIAVWGSLLLAQALHRAQGRERTDGASLLRGHFEPSDGDDRASPVAQQLHRWLTAVQPTCVHCVADGPDRAVAQYLAWYLEEALCVPAADMNSAHWLHQNLPGRNSRQAAVFITGGQHRDTFGRAVAAATICRRPLLVLTGHPERFEVDSLPLPVVAPHWIGPLLYPLWLHEALASRAPQHDMRYTAREV